MEVNDNKKSKTKSTRKPNETLLKQSGFKISDRVLCREQNIVGFDNPGKCLYTTIRELAENFLDSAESMSELPIVDITIEEIGKNKFNSMIGLIDRECVDQELYDDYEIAKDREMDVQLSDDKDLSKQDEVRVRQDLKPFLKPVREKLVQFEQELKER